MSDTALVISTQSSMSVDLMVASWLHAKEGLSHSARTHAIYEEHITKYRDMLSSIHLDLDSPNESLLATVLQAYCSYSPTNKQISSTTYMHRRHCISSFFKFAMKMRWLTSNPTELLEDRKVHHNDAALPLDRETVAVALKKIDRNTLLGKRDYALLSLLFSTGRRVSEMQALVCGDILLSGSAMTIIWQHCKGGKRMIDEIDPHVATVLMDYLRAAYKGEWREDAPVWVSFSQYHSHLEVKPAITNASLSRVLFKHLGVSKFHAGRHSFAVFMDDAGASLSEIGNRLGHASLATTSEYMKRLRSAENPYAAKLAAMLEIGG